MTSSLERYFSRILFINLERRVDRRTEADAEFTRLRMKRYERVPGIDRPDNGNAGCTATHRLLWRRIAAGELGERVLIFEDDFMTLSAADLLVAGYTLDSDTMRIFMSAPWRPVFDALPHLSVNERFDAMIEQVPEDWDVLYLGGGYQSAPIERVSRNVIRNGGMLGTVAYAMRPEFAQVITAALDKTAPGDAHPGAVDMVLCSFAREYKFYTLSPRLFIPRPGNVSDLQPGHVDGFPFSFTDPSHEQMV